MSNLIETKKPKSIFRNIFKVIAALFLIFIIGFVALGILAINLPSNTAAPANSLDAANRPKDEADMIQAVLSARARYHDGANDMIKGAARPARGTAICKAVSDLAVSDWTGQIATLSSNSDGKGVLALSIADNITLSTWNNSLSDISYQTLLDPSSAVFTAASNMKVGDIVRFSGHFFSSDIDCFNEMSLSLDGSMTAPAYTFSFSSISRYHP